MLQTTNKNTLSNWWTPSSLTEAMNCADYLSKSGAVPSKYIGKPHDILVAMSCGAPLGFSPMQSLQNIAVINGKPALYGDGVKAVILASGLQEYCIEEFTATNATIKIKRKGQQEIARTFTIEMAKKASLWGKAGPWTQYPERMLYWRAYSWAARDSFADLLMGLSIVEEIRDMPASNDHLVTIMASALPSASKKAPEKLEAILSESEKVGYKVIIDDPLIHETETGEISVTVSVEEETRQELLKKVKDLIVKNAIPSAIWSPWLDKYNYKSINDLKVDQCQSAIDWINEKYGVNQSEH